MDDVEGGRIRTRIKEVSRADAREEKRRRKGKQRQEKRAKTNELVGAVG